MTMEQGHTVHLQEALQIMWQNGEQVVVKISTIYPTVWVFVINRISNWDMWYDKSVLMIYVYILT